MTPVEIQRYIYDRAVPLMREAGVEAFSMVAYVKDGDGNIHKVCMTDCGGNIAYQDGMRSALQFMVVWSQTSGVPGVTPIPPQPPAPQ